MAPQEPSDRRRPLRPAASVATDAPATATGRARLRPRACSGADREPRGVAPRPVRTRARPCPGENRAEQRGSMLAGGTRRETRPVRGRRSAFAGGSRLRTSGAPPGILSTQGERPTPGAPKEAEASEVTDEARLQSRSWQGQSLTVGAPSHWIKGPQKSKYLSKSSKKGQVPPCTRDRGRGSPKKGQVTSGIWDQGRGQLLWLSRQAGA